MASMTGFVLGLVIIFFFFLSMIGSIIGGSQSTFKVKPNTVLEIRLNGEVPDRWQDDPFARFGSTEGIQPNTGLDRILFGLDKAAKDKNIKGIYLRTDLYAGGLATAEEIRSKIIQFRKSGKFAIAYGEVMTDAGYYIASACDKVYLNPKGLIEFNGFAGQVALYKGMFDKLGLEFEVFKAGKYKSAVEPFIQTGISEPNREQIKQYVTELFGHVISGISQSRKIDSGTLAETANLFKARNAKKALEYKLVDALKYEDEVDEELKKLAGAKNEDPLRRMSFARYAENLSGGASSDNKIAIIFAAGDINMGKDESGTGIGSESLAATIRKARLDKEIKAVVLRVNSPGGSSNASDIIAREIELCKKVKPVIVSFGTVAASGGYYIACLGDSIFAQPTTITGSIGVFALVPNTAKLYKDKMGLTYETVPTGEYAVMWRPDQPLSDAMRVYFQETVNDIYSDFIGIVSKGRKMDTARIAELAQGHVYTGMYARSLGLIDGYGGMQRAITSAAAKAKLKDYRVVPMPDEKNPFERFLGAETGEQVKHTLLKRELGEFYTPFTEAQRLLQMTGPQARMPWSIKIQ